MSGERAPSWEEVRELFAKSARETVELKRVVARVDRQVGELTNGWGRFVEALVAPAIPREFRARGFRIDRVMQRCRSEIDGKHLEIDVLAVGRDRRHREIVLAVEVRSHLQSQRIGAFIEHLGAFFRFFPEYAGRDLLGVVAGIRIDEGTADHAVEQGLYVLVPSGETVHLAVPRRFEPRVWRADEE